MTEPGVRGPVARREAEVRRGEVQGQPEHLVVPPEPVRVTRDSGVFIGSAHRWRGAWVYATWSEGVGMQHLDWVLGAHLERVPT